MWKNWINKLKIKSDKKEKPLNTRIARVKRLVIIIIIIIKKEKP